MRVAVTAAIAASVLALLAGCGSTDEGGPVPAATRAELNKQLDSIEARFDHGDGACSDIAQNQTSVEATLDGIPKDVDAQVRDALRSGFDRLFELTATQCDEQKGQQTETETTQPTPAPAPEPTPTETTPTPTETTPPPEEKPKKDKDEGKKDEDKGASGVVPQSGRGGGAVAPTGE